MGNRVRETGHDGTCQHEEDPDGDRKPSPVLVSQDGEDRGEGNLGKIVGCGNEAELGSSWVFLLGQPSSPIDRGEWLTHQITLPCGQCLKTVEEGTIVTQGVDGEIQEDNVEHA